MRISVLHVEKNFGGWLHSNVNILYITDLKLKNGSNGIYIFFTTIRHEKLKIQNMLTKRKNYTEIVQLKLLSAEDTLPLFEDFITRVERHCKEIFYTKDSKYEIAIKNTKPLPTREERKKHKEEMLRKKAMENSGEVIENKG